MTANRPLTEDEIVKIYFLRNTKSKDPVPYETIAQEMQIPLGTAYFSISNVKKQWYNPSESSVYGRAILKIKALKKQMQEKKTMPDTPTDVNAEPGSLVSSTPLVPQTDVLEQIKEILNENKMLKRKLQMIAELAGQDIDK